MKLMLSDGSEADDFINVIVVDSHTNEVAIVISLRKLEKYLQTFIVIDIISIGRE